MPGLCHSLGTRHVPTLHILPTVYMPFRLPIAYTRALRARYRHCLRLGEGTTDAHARFDGTPPPRRLPVPALPQAGSDVCCIAVLPERLTVPPARSACVFLCDIRTTHFTFIPSPASSPFTGVGVTLLHADTAIRYTYHCIPITTCSCHYLQTLPYL